MAARWDKGGKDYINCPMDREQYEAFVAALERRRKDRVQGVGEGHALLRRLHADRGDGVARARDLALRPDEAGRPRRSAHRPLALRVRPAAPGQCARHLVEHRRLPDQAEAWRAGADLPHHPGTRKCRVRAAWRDPPQQFPQFADPARPPVALQGDAAHPLRRPDHRLRRLCRKRRDRAAGRALRRGRDRRARARPAPARNRAGRAAQPHHRRRRAPKPTSR